MRRDLHALATGEIFFQHVGVGPFQIPAVFNSHERVAARHYGVQRKSSIRIRLVAAEKRGIAAQIEWREHNHYARGGLVFLECRASDAAGAFRSVDGNAHVLPAGDLKGTPISTSFEESQQISFSHASPSCACPLVGL